MKFKHILIAFIVLLFLVYGAYLIKPGVNVNGQSYWITNLPSKEFLSKSESLKNKFPDYRAYCISGKDTTELMSKSMEYAKYQHIVYFRIEERMNAFCVVDVSTRNGCIIRLVRVSKSGCSSWIDINSNGLSKEENNRIKNKFEQEILNKLGNWKN